MDVIKAFLKTWTLQYVRYTLVAHTDKMECLMICRANFFVNAETRFFGARSRNVSLLCFFNRQKELTTITPLRRFHICVLISQYKVRSIINI